VAARAPRFVRYEIVVESNFLGQPGASGRFVAFLVPPTSGKLTPPSSERAWERKTPDGVPMD
ncbi:MAG TPA: hypothetical protein VMM15_01255, partial [Bradyrhizobium sp.]|nr:hypothetical protein [Bradyrhizobium sp.]